jgi:hypothetical protein
VVNRAGVLQDGPGDSTPQHTGTAAALFAALRPRRRAACHLFVGNEPLRPAGYVNPWCLQGATGETRRV